MCDGRVRVCAGTYLSVCIIIQYTGPPVYYVCSLYVETYLTGPWPDTGGYAEDNNGREARADKQRYMATLERREE